MKAIRYFTMEFSIRATFTPKGIILNWSNSIQRLSCRVRCPRCRGLPTVATGGGGAPSGLLKSGEGGGAKYYDDGTS